MSAPNCNCRRISTSYGKTVYRCWKDGVSKIIPVGTTNENQANILVCELFNDNWDSFPTEKKHCFALSTQIVMGDRSLKSIGEIIPGELVLVSSLQNDKLQQLPVQHVDYHTANEIVEISVGEDEPIRCSSSQEYLTNSGPVELSDLSDNATLISLDHKRLKLSDSGDQVVSRTHYRTDEELASLIFDGDYYYFVGKTGRAVRCKNYKSGPQFKNGMWYAEP